MIEELGSSYMYEQWHFDCNQRPREFVIAVGKRKVRRSRVSMETLLSVR